MDSEAEAANEVKVSEESSTFSPSPEGPTPERAAVLEGDPPVSDSPSLSVAPLTAASAEEDWSPHEQVFVPEDPDPEDSNVTSLEPFRKHHVAPALISLDRIDEDETFRVRPEGEIDLLATDIARVGQLFPVDVRLRPPDRFQILSGFRRVSALRFLQRDKVLARLHTDLTDEDALLMSLAAAIHAKPVSAEELSAVKERLLSEGRLTALLRDMLDKAINPEETLSPEGVEEEVDGDELATNAAAKLAELNQDLSLIADVFSSLDEERKQELLKQLRYSAELVAYLEGL